MSSGTPTGGDSGNRRVFATISAEFAIEMMKNEMDFTEKNIVQDIGVPTPPETRKSKKTHLLKKIGWNKQKREKTVRMEEVTLSPIEESGSKKTKDHRKDGSSIRMDKIGTSVAAKGAEGPGNKDSAKCNLTSETENNKRVNKRFWPKKLRFQMKTSKKAEKEVTPRVIKGTGNDFEEGSSVSTKGGEHGTPMENRAPSGNMETSVNRLIPAPTKNQKRKKRTWWKKLIMKGNGSCKKAEKEVAIRMTSETIGNETENDIGSCTSVSSFGYGNVTPKKNAKRSSNVEFSANTPILSPSNEEDFVAGGSASLKEYELDEGASCMKGLNERERTRKKRLREYKIEIFKPLPQILKPFKMSVDGNNRESFFAFNETQLSSNQQKRTTCILYNDTGHQTVWVVPQTKNITSSLTPCGKCLYMDITAFRHLFSIMALYHQSLNRAHYSLPSIRQGQSDSEESETLHVGLAMYGFWNLLRILVDQLDSGRRVSIQEHARNDMDILKNSHMNTCHLSSVSKKDKVVDADCSAFGIVCTGSVVHVQKGRSHPGDLHGCGSFKERTAVIRQIFKLNHNAFQLNVKYDKMFALITKTEGLGSVMWNTQKREIFPHLPEKEEAQTCIVDLSNEPSMSLEPALISQNGSISAVPSKPSKYEKFRLHAATATSSISGTSSTSDVIQEKCNFSCLSNTAASQSVTAGLTTIEGLLLDAYVQYLEKEMASFMERVKALMRENEELKLINSQLQEENSNLKILLLDKLDCDGPKGNKSKEETALHLTQSKNDSKVRIMKESILGETTGATNSKNDEEKYGQTSEFHNVEIEETLSNVKRKRKPRKKSKKRPDFVRLSLAKNIERNTGLGDTIAGVISPTKLMTNTHCAEGRASVTPEENFPPIVSLDKTDSASIGRSMEAIDDVEEMTFKQLSFLNNNLDMNIAPVLTKLKQYHSLFKKKQNNPLMPLKTTLRKELQIFMKHSEQVVELRNIVQDLLEDNESCEFPGELLFPNSEKVKERSLEEVLPMRKTRVHESNCGIGTSGVVEKFCPKSSCFQCTREGQSTGNTQCKGISAKPSYADIVKRNLPADCGATSKSHSTTKEEILRKSTQTEKCPTVFPLAKERTSEGIKAYPTRIFRSNKKTPSGGSSKKRLN